MPSQKIASIKGATETQVAELRKAIEEISTVQPSLPTDQVADRYNNYGPGSQNIHAGVGDLYNSSGNARVYKANTMTFGKE